MPTATRLTIHIFAAVAEHEMILKRTKASLAEAKRRGTKLSNTRTEQVQVMAFMRSWRQQQWTLRRIADELNRLGIRPVRGRIPYESSVRNQLCRKE